LLLAVLEGLPYETIADHTGVSVGTVKSRISRARDTLERLLLEGETRQPAEEMRSGTGRSEEGEARLPVR
jgi:RNA polymerase sigma-70 factor, ECF subfamily